jgi:hypothetical protein
MFPLGHRRQDGQVEQAVVDQRVRAQRKPAAGLAAIADRERQEGTLPVETLSPETAGAGREVLQPGDAGDGISETAEPALEVGIGLRRHLRAEAAGQQVDEGPLAEQADIHCHRRR